MTAPLLSLSLPSIIRDAGIVQLHTGLADKETELNVLLKIIWFSTLTCDQHLTAAVHNYFD